MDPKYIYALEINKYDPTSFEVTKITLKDLILRLCIHYPHSTTPTNKTFVVFNNLISRFVKRFGCISVFVCSLVAAMVVPVVVKIRRNCQTLGLKFGNYQSSTDRQYNIDHQRVAMLATMLLL